MERRHFIRLAGLAGLTVSASPHEVLGSRAARNRRGYDGPLYVFVNANGGWDPTSLCDPKGAAFEDDPDRLNNFLAADIGRAGNISYAPLEGHQQFFEKHAQRLLVINGIDTKTNGHDAGQRHTWSGRLTEGAPSTAAMIAGAYDAALPMSFMSFGGYDETSGVVARTRSGNTNVLSRLAYPALADPNNEESGYNSNFALAEIERAHADRAAQLLADQQLPRLRASMNALFTARSGSNELKLLQQFLPDQLDNSGNPLLRQAQVAIAAYRAGITISAQLSIGGFDTHGQHEARHYPRLQQLVAGLDFVWEEAVRQEVADRIVIVAGSEFGRTPGYNDQNGKDHWSVTSMMLMGQGIAGNRVLGGSDENHRPLTVDPNTLALNPDGIRLEPGHVARALRTHAGVHANELATLYPLDSEELPLLG